MNRITSLKKMGHRITSQREKILNKISTEPQTVEQIHRTLENKVDLTSVYRNLQLLVNSRLAREIDFGDGKKRYELLQENDHHHHLICDKCGNIQDIRMEEDSLLKKIKTDSDFIVKKHKLEFFGLCGDCQA